MRRFRNFNHSTCKTDSFASSAIKVQTCTEKILKIVEYLATLWTKVCGFTFW